MKKLFVSLLFVAVMLPLSAQKNLSVGVKPGYVKMNGYNLSGMQYGVEASYQFGYAVELALSGLYGPNLSSSYTGNDYSLFSAGLDLRFYLIQQEIWGTGPVLGGQYFSLKNENKSEVYGADNLPGFNLGWHGRVFLSDNLQLNAGWRYTNAKTDHAYHLFYLGLAFTFDLR
ncbi:MAG: hypothetical protein LBS54_07935 [Dysgonamonadaceae bacterium]|jgi:hypothetical protein|nr:hypothetical protein [Dysgonamonadaceae bacterium]